MHNAKSLWMPVQLMCRICQRAERPPAERMRIQSCDTNGPSSSHTDAQPTSFRAEGTNGLPGLDRATRRLRNPGPVLGPDRSVVQDLPRDRSRQKTCRGSRAPYQQISPTELHCSALIGDSRDSQPLHCVAGDISRSHSSSCLRADHCAGVTSSVPKDHGCNR